MKITTCVLIFAAFTAPALAMGEPPSALEQFKQQCESLNTSTKRHQFRQSKLLAKYRNIIPVDCISPHGGLTSCYDDPMDAEAIAVMRFEDTNGSPYEVTMDGPLKKLIPFQDQLVVEKRYGFCVFFREANGEAYPSIDQELGVIRLDNEHTNKPARTKIEFNYECCDKTHLVLLKKLDLYNSIKRADTVKIGGAQIDVNNDGKKDIVGYIKSPIHCGSSGCAFHILLNNERNEYEPIGTPTTVYSGAAITNNISNGFYDLAFKGKKDGEVCLWKWGGEKYQFNQCIIH